MNEAKTYSEVIEVLNNLMEEDYNKVPKEYIDYFTKNSEEKYQFKYDSSKSFNEQSISDEAKSILFGLFAEFVANEKQKKKINLYLHEYNTRIEHEKQRQYNYSDLFIKDQKENSEGNLKLVQVKKEKIIDKIRRAIRHLLKKRK